MASTDPKKVVRRFLEEAFNKGNLSVLDDLVAGGYVGHDPAIPQPVKGPEGVKEMVGGYRAAFSDLQITIMDQLAEGDKVATRWRAVGTHDGELWGITPTGKKTTVTGIAFDRVTDGKLIEGWDNWDALGMMRQLGAIPETAVA